jgi:Xaa-Pro aminopeptidase
MISPQEIQWPDVDFNKLRVNRKQRVVDFLHLNKIDTVILTSPENIRYATDVRCQLTPERGWFALVLNIDGISEFFVPYTDDTTSNPYPDFPDVKFMHPSPAWAVDSMHPQTWTKILISTLNRMGSKVVGIEGLSPNVIESLQSSGYQTRSIDREMISIRRNKFAEEIELLVAINEVNSRACEAAIDAGLRGARDYDFLAAAIDFQFRAGVEFLSHAVSNVRKQSGDWFPCGTELVSGDAFMFDIGCYGKGGYASDLARVGFVDEPNKLVSKAYKTLLEAHFIGEEFAKAGVKASEVDAVVNRHLNERGLPTTPYAMGHGIGLRVCEAPTINRSSMMDADEVLKVGDVIALEPETSVEINGIDVVLKVEDNYVVEKDGLKKLSNARY